MFCTRDRGEHMADVLLSLKHAVVHPHQVIAMAEPSYDPVSALQGDNPDLTDNCCFLSELQSSPTNLDLPSSVLDDSFEENLIGGSKEVSFFNIESFEPTDNNEDISKTKPNATSPSIFTQLTSTPSPLPSFNLNNLDQSSGIETPSSSSDTYAERIFTNISESQPLDSSFLPSYPQSSSPPPKSLGSPVQHDSSPLFHNPETSAFTPVVPLPSFSLPRHFTETPIAEENVNAACDELDANCSYLRAYEENIHEPGTTLSSYSEGLCTNQLLPEIPTDNHDAPAPSSNLSYIISIGEEQPIPSFNQPFNQYHFGQSSDKSTADTESLSDGPMLNGSSKSSLGNPQCTDLLSTAIAQTEEEGLQSMGNGCGAYSTAGYQDPCYPNHHGSTTHVFPAMSVNVSMNMTMGVPNVNMGYGPDPNLQSQWNNCQQSSPISPMTAAMGYQNPSSNQGLMSPLQMAYSSCNQSYDVAPYTWANEFRSASDHGGSIHNFVDREPCLKSSSLRPRPATPSGAYFNPIHPGTPTSPSLGCLRRRPCSGPPQVDMSKAFLSEGLKTNLCRICGKTYARPSTLKTHLRTHSGEKPYRCDQCNKSFSQAANLTAHVRTHSGEKPFRCPICERKFSQSSSVTTHMRTHSGDRPYRCRMCKKAFSDSSTLTKHLRIHSGEKPYQCKLCLLRFSQSGNLNRHMRVHSQTS